MNKLSDKKIRPINGPIPRSTVLDRRRKVSGLTEHLESNCAISSDAQLMSAHRAAD